MQDDFRANRARAAAEEAKIRANRARAAAEEAKIRATEAEEHAAEWAWRKGVLDELRAIRVDAAETRWRLGCLLVIVLVFIALSLAAILLEPLR